MSDHNLMDECTIITLNSLVRRTERTAELKQLIKNTGATLTRKGRSRHWTMHANRGQIQAIRQELAQQSENSWSWLAKQLADNQPKLSREEIKNLVKTNPSITIKTLSIEADCTLKEAREIIDELEWE
jgi:hypothetical protein